MHVSKEDSKSGTYITEKHLNEAHEFDLVMTKRKMYAARTEIGRKERKPGRDDFAFFACKEGFTKFTNVLNDNRKFASKSFFRDIGYFFEDWTIPQQEYGIDKTTLTLTFEESFSNDYILKPTEAPPMKLYSAGDMKANEQNKDVYRDFRTSQKGLNLLVEHEVLIASSKPGSKRVHVGRVREVFKHSVHLMYVSVRIIASCAGILYNELRELDILASNKYSLYMAYTMAISLRQMLTNREVYTCGDIVIRFTPHLSDDVGDVDEHVLDTILHMLRPGATDM